MSAAHAQLIAKHASLRQTGDARLRTELVEEYRGFAIALARRFGNHREPQDDLIQAALLGLLHAIDRFDPDRGVEFTTFAFATITGELKRHYRDQTWGVRVPRSLQEQFLAVTTVTDELTVELGRSPTIAEIAERAYTSEEDVLCALEVSGAYLPVSLDGPAGDDPSRTARLSADETGFEEIEEQERLGPLVARLPWRERRIIHLRFVEELTQSQIGTHLGISQMHVCRLLAQSLDRLRRWMDEEAESTGWVAG
jgi:RNA polymerase sigma-B factor